MADNFWKVKKGLNLPNYATFGDLSSISNPQVGDIVMVGGSALYSYNGSSWVDTGSSGSVTTVNGQSGNVSLDSGDIPEDGNLYFTDARAKAAAVVDSSAGSELDQAMSVSAAKSYTDGAVSAEASLRSSADSTLQGNIDAEASARAAADLTLQGNIDAEALARSSADTTLQNNIDAEALARATAVSNEASARSAADATLQGNIDAEALARATAVSNEASARSAADATLQGNIDAEALARASADTTLQGNIDAEESARISADNTLQGNISSEASARQAADTTLQNNITAEASTRAANDLTLQGNIDAEALARSSADTTLQNNIDAEASARSSADLTLQGNIDAEASARAAADALLIPLTQKAAAGGVATLDISGKIPSSQLPPLAISSVTVVATIAERDALTPQEGDFCVVTSVNETFIYDGSAWIEIVETSGVVSVNGQSGVVSLSTSEISEGSNLYFTDARAKSAAVVDFSTGSETDQAMSVSAAKAYIAASSPVLSVNGETGAVALDSGEIPEGSNLYFTDARAKLAAVIDSMAGSETDMAPSVSSAKAAIQFRPEYARYVAKNGSDLTGNGSPSAPFLTIQAAMDSLPAAVSGSDIPDCIIYVYPGVYNQAISWTRSNTHIVGMQSPRKNIQAVAIKGAIDFNIGIAEPGGIFQNISSISNCLLTNESGSRNTVNFIGSQRVILNILNSQVYQAVSGYSAIYMDNTASSLSRIYLDNTVVQSAASGLGHAIDLVRGALWSATNTDIYRTGSADASSRAIKLSNNSLVTGVEISTISSTGSYAIEMAGTGSCTMGTSTIEVLAANKSGIYVAAGTYFSSINNIFNIGAGTGYAVDGAAGSYFYYSANTYVTNSAISSNVTKVQLSSDTTTSVIAEGSRLYFTDARAKAAAVVNSTAGSETDQAPSVSAVKSYIAASAPVLSVNGETGVVALDSGEIPEGSNLYFTDGRAQTAAVVNDVTGSQTTQAPSVSAIKNYVDSSVSTEALSRSSADTTLQNNIDAEASARAAADSTLQGNIDAEASARAAADALLIPLTQKAAANGVATLDGSGKIPSSQLPPLAISSVSVVATIAERDALTPQEGDFCVVTGINETYIYDGSAWIEVTETSGVTSVNGQSGNVSLDSGDIPEDGNLYFTDARAKAAAVVDSSAGSELDQAMSVSAAKSYTDGAVSAEASLRSSADTTLQTNIDNETLARIAADALLIPLTQKAQSNGVATLDGAGKVPVEQIPFDASPVTSVNSETGAVVLDTDDVSEGLNNKYFTDGRAKTAAVLNVTSGNETTQAPSVSAMKSYVAASSPVLSVNGETGALTLDTDNVNEGLVNKYFTDARAKTAAVVNSSAGSEQDQAMSVSAAKSYTDGAVSAEASLRSSADTTLQGNIDAEALARSSADTTLQGNIDAEASARAAADALLIPLTQKAAANGVATLDGSGKIPSSQLPPLAISSVSVVATIAERDALTPQEGDFCVVTDVNETYIYDGSAWVEVIETSGVTSVNGFSGSVSLTSDNVSEGSTNKYFTDDRAKTAAVVNSSTGSETDQAMSVSAAKAYTNAAVNTEALARQSADALLIPLSQKGAINGVATLDASGYVPLAQINPAAVPVTSVNALTGDVVLSTTEIAEGTRQYFTTTRARTAAVLNSTAGIETTQAPSVLAMKNYVAASSPVLSVNDLTGAVVLTTAEISEDLLGTNLYFTDTRARTAAVVNSTVGNQTNQAASVSAMKAYIAANTISGVIRYGASPMANSVSEFVVNFSDIGSTSYVVVITISNGVDLTVRHLSPTVTTKTSSSFTFVTAQTTDSANYVANYYIIKL